MNTNQNSSNRSKVIMIISGGMIVLALILTLIFFSFKTSIKNIENTPSESLESKAELSKDSESSDDISSIVSEVFNEVSENYESSTEDEISETVSDALLEHGWVINEYGYTYIYVDCGYEQFNYKTTALERYANSINKLASSLPESMRIFSLTVPVCSTFADIPREIYTADNFYNQSQSAFVATVSSKLNENVVSVPLVSMLEEKYDAGEYVYFRTDKNWTSLGAYYAYTLFCESAGISAHSIESFKIAGETEYLGSFYNATKSLVMADNPDSLVCYSTLPAVKTALTVYDSGIIYTDYELCNNSVSYYNAYNSFLGRAASRYELSTTSDGGSLLIIGDSSAYPFVPFVASHYSRIDIIDPRGFEQGINEFLSEHQYDDCIIMCYSTNSVSGNFIPSLNIFSGESNG